MKSHDLAFAIATFCAGAAGATADTCQQIAALSEQQNQMQLTLPATGQSTTCRRSLMQSGVSQVYCGWPFGYRDPAAKQAFEHLVATVAACMGKTARILDDQDVNHPDFYDLKTFLIGGQEVGVSLKDKAALSKTYVFLRVTVPK